MESLAIVADFLGSDLLLKGTGGAAFALHNAETWHWWHYAAWFSVIMFGLEILSQLVLLFGKIRQSPSIPHRGKHLDELEPLDVAFITFNRLLTPLFSYHLLRFCWNTSNIEWSLEKMDLINTLSAFMLLFIVYDFFYTIGHRILHHRSIYKFIHKHHHRQRAPSRGNVDAVNVHPLEFVSGEYNHLLSVFLVSTLIVPVHAVTVLVFIATGGFLASLNHTRYDVIFPYFPSVYQVKFHDIHHWYPDSNYGQYIMLWDHVFGWFKPYPNTSKGVRNEADIAERLAEKEE